MIESPVKRAPEQPTADLGDLLEDALHQAKSLIQAELSLARRELVAELKSTASSLLQLVIGVMFLQAGLVTLGVLAVLALGVGIAAVGVVIAFAAVGAVFLLVARRALAQRKLPHTTARLTRDAKQVMETVK
ncbi:MAG TPA: phage holin family protein [Polyangiaceae bacterium]